MAQNLGGKVTLLGAGLENLGECRAEQASDMLNKLTAY